MASTYRGNISTRWAYTPYSAERCQPADDTRGCAGSAVLSYGFWQSEYGGRADILGKTISIDRHPIEIVGVTEPGFNGTEVGASADVMVPLCAITL